jgi:protein-S-isoprenylcysteine O-methyltransferase Ste14
MLKRISFFAYGTLSYVIFLGTFLYAVGFIGGFGVPRTLDGPATGPLGISLAIDVVLLTVFAVQHSVMARKWFKIWWTRIVPKPIERSTYVLFSSVALILLFALWRPLGGVIWSVEDPTGRFILRSLFAFCWGLVLF